MGNFLLGLAKNRLPAIFGVVEKKILGVMFWAGRDGFLDRYRIDRAWIWMRNNSAPYFSDSFAKVTSLVRVFSLRQLQKNQKITTPNWDSDFVLHPPSPHPKIRKI